MSECIKCGQRFAVAHVPGEGIIKDDPDYVCLDCEGLQSMSVENAGDADAFIEHLRERIGPKCVKCGGVFGLYIHKGCHWCPKCLVVRILVLEDLLREKEETFVSQKETAFERQCRMEIEAAAGKGLESGDPIE